MLRAADVACALVGAQVVSTLVKNFSEGNDFFRVLLRVFQEVLLSGPQEHKHLDNFFMIVPALCIAFCDDAIIGKVGADLATCHAKPLPSDDLSSHKRRRLPFNPVRPLTTLNPLLSPPPCCNVRT